MTMTELEPYVLRAQDGDNTAWQYVLEQSFRICYDAAERLCHSLDMDTEHRDELASDGVDGLFHAVRTYIPADGSRSWYWWAYKCVHQSIEDWRIYHNREKRCLPERSLDEPVLTDTEETASPLVECIADNFSFTPDTALAEQEEHLLLLLGLLYALSPRQRVLLSLYAGIGCRRHTQQELARLCDRSPTAISNTLRRARERLRKHLTELQGVAR